METRTGEHGREQKTKFLHPLRRLGPLGKDTKKGRYPFTSHKILFAGEISAMIEKKRRKEQLCLKNY